MKNEILTLPTDHPAAGHSCQKCNLHNVPPGTIATNPKKATVPVCKQWFSRTFQASAETWQSIRTYHCG